MESKQRRSRKHSSFDDGSERAREAEREEGRRRRARKERSGQRLSPSTAIADGEREGGRKTLESSFCGRQLSPAVRPSVNEGSEKSLRFGERDWSRTAFTAEPEGSAKKGKWAAARAAQRLHWQGTRAEGERHTRRSSNTCQDREQARSTSPGPQVRGARQ